MRKRVLVSKTFNSGIVTQALMYKGMPLSKGILFKYGSETKEQEQVFFLSNVPEQISLNCDIMSAKKFFESSPALSAVVMSEGECGFNTLSEQCRGGIMALINGDVSVREGLTSLSTSLFRNTNPKTGREDVVGGADYAPYIPLVVVSGALPPQLDFASNTYFNPKGEVSVARALDSLNALKEGYASKKNRKLSLDYVSNTNDFFNEGYNKCLNNLASPFFRLFSRSELSTPITLCELCYIIVVCFNDFTNTFGSVSGYSVSQKNEMGIFLDWEHPKKLIRAYRQQFSDLSDYVVTRCSIDTYTKEDEVKSVLDVNIKSYLNGRTMLDFRQDLLSGKSALPLPYLMSVLELVKLSIVEPIGNELAPLRQVSRGEFSKILVKLADALYKPKQ